MPGGTGASRPLLVYTFARLGLFGVCAVVFYLCGMGLFLAIVAAALVSSVASYFLLARQRTELGLAVEARVTAARTKAAQRTAREDAAAEQLLAEQERAQHQD